jgi:putative ABC transport system permease protein
MFEIRPILSALSQHKSRAVLIILQMALTLAIVSNAVFIIDERVQMMNRDTGYAKEQVFSFSAVNLQAGIDMSAQVEADEDILRSIDGVIDAVKIDHVPLEGNGSTKTWSLSDKEEQAKFHAGSFRGDEHVLKTLGLQLLAGRNFTAEEVQPAGVYTNPVIIINKSLADKLFPNDDALGKTIYNLGRPAKVVGIVGEMHGMWVGWSGFYDNVILPGVDSGDFFRYMVRTEPQSRAKVMTQFEQQLLSSFDRRVISKIRTMEEHQVNAYRDHNAMRIVLTVLIGLLMFVTVIGIFGLSSFSVSQRHKQIGTRRALGASKFDIVRYFLVENCLIALMGLIIGFVLALALNYVLVNEYGISQLDNTYIVTTMFVILMLSLGSVLMPALRAAQISPALATR